MFESSSCARAWSVVECDFEEGGLHDQHEEGLDQQCGVVVGAEPVEDFQDGCHEHNERDIEGEAIAGLGAVDRQYLVRVGGDGGCYKAAVWSADGRVGVGENTHNRGAK